MCVTCAVVLWEQQSLAKSRPVEPSILHSGAWAGAEAGWSRSQASANRHKEGEAHLRSDNMVMYEKNWNLNNAHRNDKSMAFCMEKMF